MVRAKLRNVRVWFALPLAALALAASPPSHCKGQEPPRPEPMYPWSYSTHAGAVVGVYDRPSGRLIALYTLDLGRECEEPGDSTFVAQGEAFLRGVGWSDLENAGHRIHRSRDLVSVIFSAGDPQATLYFYRRGGLLYADETLFGGAGGQLWPSDPLAAWNLHEATESPPPAAVDWGAGSPDSISLEFRRLNVVADLATMPYTLSALQVAYGGIPWSPDREILIAIRPPNCAQRK